MHSVLNFVRPDEVKPKSRYTRWRKEDMEEGVEIPVFRG